MSADVIGISVCYKIKDNRLKAIHNNYLTNDIRHSERKGNRGQNTCREASYEESRGTYAEEKTGQVCTKKAGNIDSVEVCAQKTSVKTTLNKRKKPVDKYGYLNPIIGFIALLNASQTKRGRLHGPSM